ncbi:MAG: hypothetical protein RIT43_535, partial [Bacteroidota bacterium]
QIIDQPIHLDFLNLNLQKNDLSISYFKKYSIWVKNDYIFYVVEKKKEFEEIRIQQERNFFEKVLNKLFRYKLKLFHKYS